MLLVDDDVDAARVEVPKAEHDAVLVTVTVQVSLR